MMGNASTSAPSVQLARRHAGILASGILAVGLVTAPPPDVDGVRTEVVAVQFAAFARPSISGSPNVNRQLNNAELSPAVTTYDTAEDLNWQYWLEDLGSAIVAIPGILLIGVPFIAILAAGVVIGTALAFFDQIAAALGLPSRYGVAAVSASKNVENVGKDVAPAVVADPQVLVRDTAANLRDEIATSAGVIRQKVRGVMDPTVSSLVQPVRTTIKQVVKDLGDAVKLPIAKKHPFEAAGRETGSLSSSAPKTPVRDAIRKTGADLKKAINQFSDRAEKAPKKALARAFRHSGHTE
jgi:hypothetical protein